MIETDPRFKSTLAAVEARPRLPVRRMVAEALELLRGAPSPRPRSDAIISARARLSNDRSKLVESRVLMLQELSLLKGARDDLGNFLVSKYANYLGSVKNRQSRDALLGRALKPILKRVRELESGVEAVNAVIADLDSRAYSIRDTIEAIRLGEREA